MDLSYGIPTVEELHEELRKKTTEIMALRLYIDQRDREFCEKEKKIREETLVLANNDKEAEKKYYQQEQERIEFYHKQKVILKLR